MPGQYIVVLTVNGKTYSQPLTVKMDPRVKTPVKTPATALAQQFKLSQQVYKALLSVVPALSLGRTEQRNHFARDYNRNSLRQKHLSRRRSNGVV